MPVLSVNLGWDETNEGSIALFRFARLADRRRHPNGRFFTGGAGRFCLLRGVFITAIWTRWTPTGGTLATKAADFRMCRRSALDALSALATGGSRLVRREFVSRPFFHGRLDHPCGRSRAVSQNHRGESSILRVVGLGGHRKFLSGMRLPSFAKVLKAVGFLEINPPNTAAKRPASAGRTPLLVYVQRMYQRRRSIPPRLSNLSTGRDCLQITGILDFDLSKLPGWRSPESGSSAILAGVVFAIERKSVSMQKLRCSAR